MAMMTASRVSGPARQRRRARLWPRFFSQLPDFFKSQWPAEPRDGLERLAGQRWCDATERQAIDAFLQSPEQMRAPVFR
jgi:hypothetical protein